MSIRLREISQRTGGGEIARETELIGTVFTIGRGTDCNIQVADLAVMLRHATLRIVDRATAVLDAAGGVPLRIDGRYVEHAEVDVVTGAKLTLGDHELVIEAGDAGAVVLTVERVAAAVDYAGAGDEARIFSLGAVLPGKRVMAWALVVLLIGFGLGWPIWWHAQARPPAATLAVQPAAFHPDEVWNPGPLSRAHANLSHNCGACHDKAFASVRDDQCRACHSALPDHAPIRRMQRARAAPAGVVAVAQARLAHAAHLTVGRCAQCHSEHQGPNGALLVASNFCAGCHKGLGRRLPDTMLLDASDFGSGGHPQFRPTLVIDPGPRPEFARLSLDTRPQEHSGLKFPHGTHMAEGGTVQRMAAAGGTELNCASCHKPNPDGLRFRAVEMQRDCGACHDLAFDRDRSGTIRTLPHGKPREVVAILRDFYAGQPGWAGFRDRRRPGLVPGIQSAKTVEDKVRAVFSPGGACFDCHDVLPSKHGVSFAVAPVRVADHYLPKGRFPHASHASTHCATCHAAATTSVSSVDVMLPGIATCRQCHGNPQSKAPVPSDCQTCHGYHDGADADRRIVSASRRPQNGQNRVPPSPGVPGPGSQGTPSWSDRTTGSSVNTGS